MAMTIVTTTIITMTSIAITTITTVIPMLMTTNKARPARPDAGQRRGSTPSGWGEAAALYRLMTWLSPSFPVGAFSYSSGIEWAVEAGDIVDARIVAGLAGLRCCGWVGILRRRVSGARASGRIRAPTTPRCGTSPNLRRPSCPRASASSRPRRRDARSSTSRARPGIATGWTSRFRSCDGAIVYPGRGRPGQRGARHPPRADDACVPARH